MKTLITALATLAVASFAHAHCGSCSTDEMHGDAKSAHAKCFAGSMDAYFSIQQALASDDLKAAQSAAAKLDKNIASSECARDGEDCCAEAASAAETIADAKDLSAARKAFHGFSQAMIAQAESHGAESLAYKMYCPMAFNNQGAAWLQNTPDLRNPYFGASMLTCGMKQATFGKDGETKAAHGHSDHGDHH